MKIILDGKLVPCVIREDMEKHHPNLMAALDKLATQVTSDKRSKEGLE